jgi:hypothetical protein
MTNFNKTIEGKDQDKVLFRSGDELLTDPEAFQAQMVAAREEYRQIELLSERIVEGVILDTNQTRRPC